MSGIGDLTEDLSNEEASSNVQQEIYPTTKADKNDAQDQEVADEELVAPPEADKDDTQGMEAADEELVAPPEADKDEILSWILTIAAAAVIAFIINTFLIVNATVPTGSMENTIMPKDRIVAFRWAHIFGDYKRGDILVFKNPDNEDELYVKRLIGLPGDTVTIIDGLVYINDSTEPLDEQYVNGTPIGSFGPYVVPEGSYFMLGDNRNNSKDARFWINTYVSGEKVLGKVYFRYYPMPKMLTSS